MKVELDDTSMPQIRDCNIAVLQGKWYREYVDLMVAKCVTLLESAGCPSPQIHILPGALELPLAARSLIRTQPNLEAVICFGAIMKGDTDHYGMIMDECIRGLGAVTLSEDVPILVEVLPVSSEAQLEERSRDDQFNKGIEAALAAVEIVSWRRSLQEAQTGPDSITSIAAS